MKQKHNAERKSRTRVLIQAGALVQKSGIMDVFQINLGEDLQNYENRHKALQLLGFLTICFEDNTFDEESLEKWRRVGERRI